MSLNSKETLAKGWTRTDNNLLIPWVCFYLFFSERDWNKYFIFSCKCTQLLNVPLEFVREEKREREKNFPNGDFRFRIE